MNIVKTITNIFRKPTPVHEEKRYVTMPIPLYYALSNVPGGLDQIFESTDTYWKNWVVNICVYLISTNAASLPRSLVDKNGETVENDISNLVLNRPSYNLSGSDLFEIAVASIILGGNSYNYVTGTPKRPLEITPLIFSEVQPNENAERNKVINYGYNGKLYNPEEIIHIYEFDPSNYLYGQSRLKSGIDQLRQQVQIGRYKVSTFANGAYPSLNLHTDQQINREQRDILRESIAEFNQGTDNAGNVLITGNGLKAIPLVMTPEDLEMLKSEQFTAANIATLLGIPPELLGALIDKKNTATYRESRGQFYEMTVIPLHNKVLQKFNHYFFNNSNYKFVTNTNQIKALQKNTEELGAAWWLTPNEKREAQGYLGKEGEEYNKIYIPSSYVPVEDISLQTNNQIL